MTTKDTKSTTIRIKQSTKEKMINLSFVRKHTPDEILLKLIEIYNKHEGGWEYAKQKKRFNYCLGFA